MGQVTIYLEDDVEKKMLVAVQSSGLSKSRWVSKLVKEEINNEWPDSVREMAGTWDNFHIQDVDCGVFTSNSAKTAQSLVRMSPTPKQSTKR